MTAPARESLRAHSAALAYSSRYGERALLIATPDEILEERYGAGLSPQQPHALYSGTKSFWGVLATAVRDDGLLELDEPVARTVEEWRTDIWKSRVTLRQLLNLTSGMPFGGLGKAVPLYGKALATPLQDEPGTVFRYSGIPLQVFGAVLARKLSAAMQTPHDFLRLHILDRAGVNVASWRTLADGTRPLPTGAFLTARDWCLYGGFLLRAIAGKEAGVLRPDSVRECLEGSAVNARYGLGFWLYRSAGGLQVAYASGSGGQALYLVPERELVVVRFADGGGSYKHETFLSRLLSSAP
ncbi:MAG: beta-lactamase family protein [Candidatus Eremiobacteraeota bacterium]|nr:beta-lactamase family protein [Candidatus Eremiobacteraeota bacterium]